MVARQMPKHQPLAVRRRMRCKMSLAAAARQMPELEPLALPEVALLPVALVPARELLEVIVHQDQPLAVPEGAPSLVALVPAHELLEVKTPSPPPSPVTSVPARELLEVKTPSPPPTIMVKGDDGDTPLIENAEVAAVTTAVGDGGDCLRSRGTSPWRCCTHGGRGDGELDGDDGGTPEAAPVAPAFSGYNLKSSARRFPVPRSWQ